MSATSTTAPLLVELFTEELPPKALKRLSDSFSDQVLKALSAKGLVAPDARLDTFATPRRLAFRISQVLDRAPDRNIELKGPSLKVGLDAAGNPTQALVKWAQKQGVSIESLQRSSDGKQEVFTARTIQPGETLAAVIGTIIGQALAKLPVPKLMQYQLADGKTTVEFVRPAHALTVLHGQAVLPASVLGLTSSNRTRGHRFQSTGWLEISNADTYEQLLAQSGRVMASFESRRAAILNALESRAAELNANLGERTDVDALLDEVCALVEWPAVYVGQFAEEFLAVPQECLILTMRTNQKYFPLFGETGKLQSRFLIVSNMEVADPSLIIDGNERVVRPRLADARFFYEQDRRHKLDSRLPQLASVVYHAKLGSQADRMARVRAIAASIGAALDCASEERAAIDRAATLAKTDLLTGMVGEFPELQGIMGRYYALHDGEPPEVADAIADQYSPRFAGDVLPRGRVGLVLALADKLETLAGMFAIGQQPTGDRDPFALRRHALGVLRMLIERGLALDLDTLIADALAAFSPAMRSNAAAATELAQFCRDRLAGYLRERQHSAAEISAVLETESSRLADLPHRLDAVRAFSALPAAQALAAANKRTGNILRKNAAPDGARVDAALLQEPAERALAAVIDGLEPQVTASLSRGDYTGALSLLAQAREPVDAFFNDVMVMVEDARLRDNRLALLTRLHHLMNRVADISKLSA